MSIDPKEHPLGRLLNEHEIEGMPRAPRGVLWIAAMFDGDIGRRRNATQSLRVLSIRFFIRDRFLE